MYTKEEIINKLNEYKYAGRHKVYDTCLKQDAIRWGYRKRQQFENDLRDNGLKNFAYIKFCLSENGEKFGLVAGKSASKNVIGRSDLLFSTNTEHGKARRWLQDENKEWCQTEVLIIGAISEDDKENRSEAFQIEQDLKDMFGLCNS